MLHKLEGPFLAKNLAVYQDVPSVTVVVIFQLKLIGKNPYFMSQQHSVFIYK